jgi:hypothetical protein
MIIIDLSLASIVRCNLKIRNDSKCTPEKPTLEEVRGKRRIMDSETPISKEENRSILMD